MEFPLTKENISSNKIIAKYWGLLKQKLKQNALKIFMLMQLYHSIT